MKKEQVRLKRQKTAAPGRDPSEPQDMESQPFPWKADPAPLFSHRFSEIRVSQPQAKLTVSQPGDPYELEADRVADTVMSMHLPEPASTLSRREDERVARKAAPGVQRTPETEEKKPAAPETTTSEEPEKPDPLIEKLELADAARAAAQALKKKRPDLTLTSGRRTVGEQAQAMAGNIIKSGSRNWIGKTYLSGTALQQWVDDHPEALTVDALTRGLDETLNAMPSSEQEKISKHLSGKAFDVQPVEKDAEEIKKELKALPGVSKFIDKEGGLDRWHVQFKKAGSEEPEASRDVTPLVSASIGSGGQPMDADTRAFMEPRFGHDFSQVRIHADAQAAESARAVNARAYAVGSDVVFGAGQYAPGTGEGRRLLAHELTHVVQQGGAASAPERNAGDSREPS